METNTGLLTLDDRNWLATELMKLDIGPAYFLAPIDFSNSRNKQVVIRRREVLDKAFVIATINNQLYQVHIERILWGDKPRRSQVSIPFTTDWFEPLRKMSVQFAVSKKELDTVLYSPNATTLSIDDSMNFPAQDIPSLPVESLTLQSNVSLPMSVPVVADINRIENEAQYETFIDQTLVDIKNLMIVKGREYRRNNNPFHNFDRGSKRTGHLPERVLDGYLDKHLGSYIDILEDLESGKLPTEHLLHEKFKDILVYFLIQYAQFIKRVRNSEESVDNVGVKAISTTLQ